MLMNLFAGFCIFFDIIFHYSGGLKEQHWLKLIWPSSGMKWPSGFFGNDFGLHDLLIIFEVIIFFN